MQNRSSLEVRSHELGQLNILGVTSLRDPCTSHFYFLFQKQLLLFFCMLSTIFLFFSSVCLQQRAVRILDLDQPFSSTFSTLVAMFMYDFQMFLFVYFVINFMFYFAWFSCFCTQVGCTRLHTPYGRFSVALLGVAKIIFLTI